jgi:hypothetical protein
MLTGGESVTALPRCSDGIRLGDRKGVINLVSSGEPTHDGPSDAGEPREALMPDRTRISALLAAAAVASGFSVALGSAAEDELMQRAKEVFQPIPEQPPSLAGNPITPDKVELGKMLFFEPRLSESWMLSCNACHNLATGGVDLQETSIGHGWRKGPRNAPTVLNAAFNIAQFWDGRAADLEEQATGPMMNPGLELTQSGVGIPPPAGRDAGLRGQAVS